MSLQLIDIAATKCILGRSDKEVNLWSFTTCTATNFDYNRLCYLQLTLFMDSTHSIYGCIRIYSTRAWACHKNVYQSLKRTATRCNMQHCNCTKHMCSSVLQHGKLMHRHILQHTATHCITGGRDANTKLWTSLFPLFHDTHR